MGEPVDIRLGAFPEALADLAPESAALLVADPPWNDLQAWAEASRFANRVLVPGGILLGYIGNRWCFEAIERLSLHLSPVRLAFLPAQHESPWDAAVKCLEAGSHIVIMAKGAFDPPGTWRNMVEGGIRGARWHPFQRPLINLMHYVEAFSRPGDLVVDPFLGSGTTALACVQLDRRIVGCDIDPTAVEATRARLDQFARTQALERMR